MSVLMLGKAVWGESQRRALKRILEPLDLTRQLGLLERSEMVAALPERVRSLHLQRIRRELTRQAEEVREKQRACGCERCRCRACIAKRVRCGHTRYPDYYVRNGISYECYLEEKAVDMELREEVMLLDLKQANPARA